jgi:hypothetical protein
MKKLLGILIILIYFSCNKDLPNNSISKQDTIVTQISSQPKVGFVIDTNWFKNTYPGYWIETHRWYGYGDFNKDGKKDLVVMFATNSPANINHQKDTSGRIVIGVFINHKTYFELDTNLVYSYLGGYTGVNVADINHDGYLDIYQMTGYWEGSQYPKPSYYNNSGHGGMDSYVYINNKNKGFIKYTIPVEDNAGSTTSIIYDNNKNGMDEIYLSSCQCYYEFNNNTFVKNELNLDKTYNGILYDIRVLTPKYADNKTGIVYLASDNFSDTYFILKIEGNKIVPKIKYNVPYHLSGFTDGTNGEREEMYIEDLNKDGKLEYIIPSGIFNTNTTPYTPYLIIIDEVGNDVSSTYLDSTISKPLTYDQMNWLTNHMGMTGFIYHTFADVDNDGIKEIFPASGIGYKKDNDTYYYKFINGKYRLQFYHTGWFGNVVDKNTNYWPFVDEKNNVNVFLPGEKDLYNTIFKSF